MSSSFRWRIALLVSAAIAISYLDRQTFPWAIDAIRKDIPISATVKANLDSAFLATYGVMYLIGGRMLDYLGTRVGFALVMIFWSLACASHGFAEGTLMLGACRLLLGAGEGGGFPAATRAVAEWFPVRERSTAMGIINAGTAIGGVAAPLLIAEVLQHAHWLNLAPWRWVFFITGALGLAWTCWWLYEYYVPARHPRLSPAERLAQADDQPAATAAAPAVPILELLRQREVWGVVVAKFLSDAVWYFYVFWFPSFMFATFHVDIKDVKSVGWIPFAAAGVGCLVGGGLSSWLLGRGRSVDFSRKCALGLSAACMPWVALIPGMESQGWVIFIYSLAFFGQQSWSTLVMILPTDMIPRQSIGVVAGMVGFGGAMGGVVLGQLAGRMLDHGYGYDKILYVASTLHILAFIVICVTIRQVRQLHFSPEKPA